jgi:hypothetical protein
LKANIPLLGTADDVTKLTPAEVLPDAFVENRAPTCGDASLPHGCDCNRVKFDVVVF